MQSSHREVLIRVAADTKDLAKGMEKAFNDLGKKEGITKLIDERVKKQYEQLGEAVKTVTEQVNILQEATKGVADDKSIQKALKQYEKMKNFITAIRGTLDSASDRADSKNGITSKQFASSLDSVSAKVRQLGEEEKSVLTMLDAAISKSGTATAQTVERWEKALTHLQGQLAKITGGTGNNKTSSLLLRLLGNFGDSDFFDKQEKELWGKLEELHKRLEDGEKLKAADFKDLPNGMDLLNSAKNLVLQIEENNVKLKDASDEERAILEARNLDMRNRLETMTELFSMKKPGKKGGYFYSEDLFKELDKLEPGIAQRFSAINAGLKNGEQQIIQNLKNTQSKIEREIYITENWISKAREQETLPSGKPVTKKQAAIEIPLALSESLESLTPKLEAIIAGLQQYATGKPVVIGVETGLPVTANTAINSQVPEVPVANAAQLQEIADLRSQLSNLLGVVGLLKQQYSGMAESANEAETAVEHLDKEAKQGAVALNPEQFQKITESVERFTAGIDNIGGMLSSVFAPDVVNSFTQAIVELNNQLKTTLELFQDYLKNEVKIERKREARAGSRQAKAKVTDMSPEELEYQLTLAKYRRAAATESYYDKELTFAEQELSLQGLRRNNTNDPLEFMERTSHEAELLKTNFQEAEALCDTLEKKLLELASAAGHSADEVQDIIDNSRSYYKDTEAGIRNQAKFEDKTERTRYDQEEKDRIAQQKDDEKLANQIANGAEKARKAREKEQAKDIKLYTQQTEALQKHLADMEKLSEQEAQQDIRNADKRKAYNDQVAKEQQATWNKQLDDAKKAAEEVAKAQKDLKAKQTDAIANSINKYNIMGYGADFNTPAITERQTKLDEKFQALLDIENSSAFKQMPKEMRMQYQAYLDELLQELSIADADFAEKLQRKRESILNPIRNNYVEELLDYQKVFNDKLKGVVDKNGQGISADDLIKLSDDDIKDRFNQLSDAGQQAMIQLRDIAKKVFDDINNEIQNVDINNILPDEIQQKIEAFDADLKKFDEAVVDSVKNEKLYTEQTNALQKHLADMQKLSDQQAEQDIKDADRRKAYNERLAKEQQAAWDKQLDMAKKAAKAVADAQRDLKAVQTNLILGAINKDNIAGSGVDFNSYGSITERQSKLNDLYNDLLNIENSSTFKQMPKEMQAQYRAYLDELLRDLSIADADFAKQLREKRTKILEGARSDYIDKLVEYEKSFGEKLKGVTDNTGATINITDLISLDDATIASRFSNISEQGQKSLIALRDTAKQAFDSIQNELATVDLSNLTPDQAQIKLEGFIRIMQDLHDAIAETSKEVKAQTLPKDMVPGYTNIKTIDEFHESVDKYTASIQGATDMSGKFSENGMKWVGTFTDANGVVQQLTLSFNQLVGVMQQSQFAKRGSDVGWLTDGLGGLKAGAKDIAKMTAMFLTFGNAAHGAMMMVRSSMQQGRQAVLDYDKALTNIKYTMDMSKEQFDALGESTVNMARELKLSISDAMTISQIYANMKTTSEEILTSARPTAILSNLVGVSTEDAANYIQSVQQQFDMLDTEASHIVDVYDKVSASIKMDYSKGVKNIAGGVQAAGQVAHDAGLEFEELAAIIGKVTERTREDGSAIGNALKTIITRISKASKLSGADEVDNETISKAAKALHDVGVEVYERNGEFRNLRDILSELANVWDDLTDAQRANISFEVAATRQSNKFKAILLSLTDSLELATEAQEANGNAEANQIKYMESMGGLIQGIKTDMEAFWLSMYNDDAIKGVLKFAGALTTILNDTVEHFGATGIIVGATFVTAISKSVIAGLGPLLATKVTSLLATIGASWGEKLATSMGVSLSKKAAATVATALGGLGVAVGAALGIAAIAGAVKIYQDNNKQIQESRVKAQEHAEAIKQQSESYESLTDKIKENKDILDDASSTDDQIYTAKSNLYDIQNQLVETYGDEAKAIDLVNGKYEEQLDLINQLSKQQVDDWLNGIQEDHLMGGDRTGWQIAEDAQRYLSEPAQDRVWVGHQDTPDTKEAAKIIDDLLNKFNLMRDITGEIISKNPNATETEYAEALENFQDELSKAITENANNSAVRDDLVKFKGSVSSGLSEIVAAIKQAYAYVDMLVIGNRDAYNDEQQTGGVVFDDVEGALKDASEAYNKAVANGTLTKEIEEEFERAANAAKAFAMSSEEAAEEQDKVHQQINALMRSYGKGNLDYSKRKYVQNADGSMSTIETIDEDILGGRFSVKMASTGFTDAQIDQWFETIEQGLQKKINNGEKISVDDLLELDKTNSILFAREGSYEQNKKLFDQFEDDIYLLKEYGVELERGKNRTLDTSPAEHYLKQIAEGVTGSEAYRRQQAIQQINSSPSLKEGGLLRGKGYNILDLKNKNFKNIDDLNTYNSIVKIFEDLGLTVDDANDYLIETGACLGEISEEAEKASDEMKKVFSVSDATSELENIKKVSDAIGGLITSIQEADDGKGLDISGLSTVQGTFKDIFPAEELDAYVVRLNAAKDSSEDTTAILKEMMVAWANQSQYLDQTGESYKILRDALEEVGFTIAGLSDEQIDFLENQWESIKASQQQAKSEEEAAQAIADSIAALDSEGGALGLTRSEWINYYLAKFSGTGSFSTAGDQAALMALASALDNAQSAWIDFYKARADILKEAKSHVGKVVSSGATTSEIRQDKGIKTAVNAAVDAELNNLGFSGFSSAGKRNAVEKLAQSSKIARASRAMNDEASDQGISSSVMGNLVQEAILAGERHNQEFAEKQLEAMTKELIETDVTGGVTTGYTPPEKTDSGKGGSGGSGGSDKDKKEPKELDWIQRRIDLLEKQHEIEQDIASDEQKSYAERIASLETLQQQDQFIIDVLKAGADEYKKTYEEAFKKVKELAGENQTLEGVIGEVDTVEELRNAIEKGEIAVDQYGEEAYEAIDTAINAYDKYMDQVDQVRQKEKEAHEHFMEEYNLRIQELQEYNSYVQAQGTNIQNELALIEARGEVVTEGVYRDLIRNSKEQIGLYEDQMAVYEEMLDELDEGSAEYNQTLASIQECANAIQQCELNQIEWNEAIKDIPIKRIEKYLAIIENIKTDILNYISEQEVIGAVVGAEPYEQLMDLGQRSLSKLMEQQKLYADKLKDYDFGSEKYNETSDAMQQIDSEISGIIQDMGEWTKSILNLPIEKLNKINENLNITKASIDDLLDDYNTVLSGVSYLFEQQTEEIQKQRDEYEKLVDEQVDGIQKIIDALEKQNEEREKQMAIEQASYNLQRSLDQKTVAIVSEGRRQFIADQEAVRAAQQEMDSAQYEKQIYDLQQQIEELEKERDERLKAYDDSLDFLDQQAEKWSTIVSNIEGARDMLVSLQYLGNGWDDKILSGQDEDIYNVFKANYKAMSDQQYTYEKQIESNDRIATLMQAYVDAFVSGSMTYEKTLSGLQSLTKNIDNSLTALENIDETRKLFGGGSFDQILSTQQKDATAEANNYPEYLKLVQQNNKKLDEYNKNWEELRKQVEEEKALLEKQWKELQEQKEHTKTLASTVRRGSERNEVCASGTFAVVYRGGDGNLQTYKVENGQKVEGSEGAINGGKFHAGDVIRYHDGIDNGAVGKADDIEKIKALKKMSLTPLKPNEVPAILKAGEVVLNDTQQSNLLSNIKKIGSSFGQKVASGVNVNLNMSNLTFHEINNGQDFANFITKNLSSAVAQGLSRA